MEWCTSHYHPENYSLQKSKILHLSLSLKIIKNKKLLDLSLSLMIAQQKLIPLH